MTPTGKHRIYWDPAPTRQHVLRIVLQHAASWDDFAQMVDSAAEMGRRSASRDDVIVEPRALMPPGNAIPHLQRGRKLITENPNMGLLVIVVPSIAMLLVQTLQRMMEMLQMSIPQTCFVNSLDAATRLIETNRQRNIIPSTFDEAAPNIFLDRDAPSSDTSQDLEH